MPLTAPLNAGVGQPSEKVRMREFLFVALGLLLPASIGTASQGTIQKSTEATERACSEIAVVVAANFYHQGESQTADLIKTACAKAPVTLTRLVVLPDGLFRTSRTLTRPEALLELPSE